MKTREYAVRICDGCIKLEGHQCNTPECAFCRKTTEEIEKENRTDENRLLDRSVMRPGAGWRYLAGSVWEHTSGARIHTMGMIRLPDQTYLSLSSWVDGENGRKLVRINGGNKKRGLMAWAASLVGE